MPQRLKKISGGVEKTASMIVLVLVFAFILYLTVYSLFETSYLSTDDPSGERIIYYNDNAFLSIIILTILLLAGYLFYRRCDPINPRTMEKVLLVWTFLGMASPVCMALLGMGSRLVSWMASWRILLE